MADSLNNCQESEFVEHIFSECEVSLIPSVDSPAV